MTIFYLIRQADSEPEGKLPNELWPLNPKGQEQSRKLTHVLGQLGIQQLYSSHERAAIETVQPFAQTYGLKILVLTELREHKIAEKSQVDLSTLREKAWQDFDFVQTPYESSRTAQKRLVQAMQSLMLHHQEEVVAIALHSSSIALFLNAIDPKFTYKLWQDEGLPELIRLTRGEYNLSWSRLDNNGPALSIVRNGERR